MGLFHSIGQFFKSLGHQASGNIDQATDRLRSDTSAVKASTEGMIRERIEKLKEYRGALATMVQRKDEMLDKARNLTKEVGRLEDLKAGSAAKVRQLVAKLKGEGKAQADIQADPEYKDGAAAFERFTKDLNEKQAEIDGFEDRAEELESTIANHKEQLAEMLKSIDELKKESAELVADVAAANAETEARDLLDVASGASRADEELRGLRELRARSNAEARISNELVDSGSKVEDLTREFLDASKADAMEDEFAALIGLDAEPPAPASKPAASDADAAEPEAPAADKKDEFKLPE